MLNSLSFALVWKNSFYRAKVFLWHHFDAAVSVRKFLVTKTFSNLSLETFINLFKSVMSVTVPPCSLHFFSRISVKSFICCLLLRFFNIFSFQCFFWFSVQVTSIDCTCLLWTQFFLKLQHLIPQMKTWGHPEFTLSWNSYCF